METNEIDPKLEAEMAVCKDIFDLIYDAQKDGLGVEVIWSASECLKKKLGDEAVDILWDAVNFGYSEWIK